MKKLPLLRGDILNLEWIGDYYRNDGKLGWDGNNIVFLRYDVDDYGSAPKDFTFPEFPPDHFSESIDHNNLINLSSEKIQEVMDNFDIETQNSYITDKYNKYPISLSPFDNVEIDFEKIYFDCDTLEYSLDNKDFVSNIPVETTNIFNLVPKASSYIINFDTKWKNAIKKITPLYKDVKYEWKENVLEVNFKFY